MTIGKRPETFGVASVVLHWLMLVLIVGVYAAIELREFWPKGSVPREGLKNLHFMLGLSVLALVWFRIAARLIWRVPSPVAGPQWRKLAATATHVALYLLMIAMPIAGWLILSAEGKAIPFFGLELPPLTASNDALAERTEELHELGATLGYWLIGLHAAASLFHHYILKDGLLFRMRLARRPNV